MVKLSEDALRKVATYSLGMKQRLAIAYSLLADPQVLILDEPTNGLDPSGIREIRELIWNLNKDQGKTIFLFSHLLQEVELLCLHLAILHSGKIIFQGEMSVLKAQVPQTLLLHTSNNAQALHLLRSDHNITFDSYGFLRATFRTQQEIATCPKSPLPCH